MDAEFSRGVHVTPGAGIIARLGSFAAFARGDDDGINQLIVRLNALADAPWAEVVRTLTSDIAESGFDNHPELACASVDDDRVGVLVFGDLELVLQDTDGTVTRFAGRDSSTWIDLSVQRRIDRIRCGPQSTSAVVGVLRDGVVPGGGFLFDRHGPIPAAGRWDTETGLEDSTPELAAEPADLELRPAAGDLVERTADVEPEISPTSPVEGSSIEETEEPAASRVTEPMPAPIVRAVEVEAPFEREEIHAASDGDTVEILGVRCPHDHLSDPRSPVCRTCGAAIADDAEPTTGSRPSLGTLTFDDGASLELVRPVVIGSDVPGDYEVTGVRATVVELANDDESVSPIHLEVRLIGWEIEVADMHSTCGTFTRGPVEGQSRTRLRPGQPALITAGTEVKIGSRSFVYSVGPRPPAVESDDAVAQEISWLQMQR